MDATNTCVAYLAPPPSGNGGGERVPDDGLSKANNPWIPSRVAQAANIAQLIFREQLKTQEIHKGVQSIFNKLVPENFKPLSEILSQLTVDTLEQLEGIVDIFFETIIRDTVHAALYITLCIYLSHLEVNYFGTTISFSTLLIDKFRDVYELNKTSEMDSLNKLMEITLCDDPEKKETLQVEFDKYNRYVFKRNIFLNTPRYVEGYFPPEVHSVYMLEILLDFIPKFVKEPFTCLCQQLEANGQYINQCPKFKKACDLMVCYVKNKTGFEDLPTRTQHMLLDILKLKNNNWIYTKPNDIELSVEQKLDAIFINVVREYQQKPIIDDVIYLLTEDPMYSFRTKHHGLVVEHLLRAAFELPLDSKKLTGELIVDLLSHKVISVAAVVEGIKKVINDWENYLPDYPLFYSYVAAIIAPILISNTACFEFEDLSEACATIHLADISALFVGILREIFSAEETRDFKSGNGGIMWMYRKWLASKHIFIDTFAPVKAMNVYFTNDRAGVFVLSIALYDQMKRIDNNEILFDEMRKWITENVDAKVVRSPLFVRALAIANAVRCYELGVQLHCNKLGFSHVLLLSFYVGREHGPSDEATELQTQCLYGIQTTVVALKLPANDIVPQWFAALYRDRVVRKQAFALWKEADGPKIGFEEDLATKPMMMVDTVDTFFAQFETENVAGEGNADGHR